MLYSNYNVLTLHKNQSLKYKTGDTYKSTSNNSRERRFDGLEIKSIDNCFGVRLHFDWNEWESNTPI